ncbi:TPA: hypothetical protein ACH3X1_003550 [Trebouxia sp. C0004]
MIEAPPLYNTSGNISSVQLAWSEWSFGSTTTAERVKKIKTDNTLVMGRRNSTLHRKNRHLPQLIEAMILAGESEATAVSLVVQMAEHMALTLDQMREGQDCLPVTQPNRTTMHSQLKPVSLWDSTDRQCSGLTSRSPESSVSIRLLHVQ